VGVKKGPRATNEPDEGPAPIGSETRKPLRLRSWSEQANAIRAGLARIVNRVPPGLNRFFAASGKFRIPALSPALNLLVICGVAGAAAMVAFLPPPAQRYPLANTLKVPSERELRLLTATGVPFARRGGCVASRVTAAELPKHFVDALLAMEDRRFYAHLGIDPVGILRAANVNAKAGRVVQGGSTLTQQLAKISYLSSARTFDRKLEEAVIALRLELALSKDEILERYLSKVYFGEGCYGLRAAARHYFDKPVGALTVSESAFLVALLRAPSELASDRERARQRTRLVLEAMVEEGTLEADALKALSVTVPDGPARQETGAYFADWIAETAKVSDDGELSPLTIRTSFDPKLQQFAEAAVRKILGRDGKRRRAGQAALVAMRPDGQVVAMVGGRDHERSQFNRATNALRQPGSAFKTFVYLAALRGGASPDMHVVDAPISIGTWSPENYGRTYRGPVTLQRAFASSINTVAVRLSEAVGRRQVITTARDLGLTTPLTPTPSLALGVSEVTLLQLTSAYAAIAADAYPVKPWGVVSYGQNGQTGGPPSGSGRWRLEKGGQMRALLAATVNHGTARAARLPLGAYGKTGTSQDFCDAWFVGFAGNLVVGVWVGNDDNSSMRRVTGGSLPALIWRQFVDKARRHDPGFKARGSRVAAFRGARRNHRSFTIAWSELEALSTYETQFASGNYYGSIYGHRPALFARPARRWERRQPRPRQRWRSRRSGASWRSFR